MIRQHWNALSVGDYVLVHDETDYRLPARPGRVIDVQPAPGTNDVAIRVAAASGPSRIVHPGRLSVHLDELDPDRHCWRCDTHARAAATT